VFQVTLQHPAGWRRVEGYEEKYGGADGFFQLSAMDGRGWTIEEACKLQAGHHLRPYGSSPQLERRQVQGQEACVIWPSEDQAQDMKGQAALLVRYPQPIQIRGDVYRYFILWADKNHIAEIAKTLQFAASSESSYTGPDWRHPRHWNLEMKRE
jgi:TolB protein